MDISGFILEKIILFYVKTFFLLEMLGFGNLEISRVVLEVRIGID